MISHARRGSDGADVEIRLRGRWLSAGEPQKLYECMQRCENAKIRSNAALNADVQGGIWKDRSQKVPLGKVVLIPSNKGDLQRMNSPWTHVCMALLARIDSLGSAVCGEKRFLGVCDAVTIACSKYAALAR